MESYIIAQGLTNQTVLHNITISNPTTDVEITSTSLGFVNLAVSLFAFSIRYSSVFWYTNKILSGVFALQLMFSSFNSLFSYVGMALLYKLGVNQDLIVKDLGLHVNPYVVLALFIIGGIILVGSSVIFFEYSSMYFQEKFMILNKKHNPEEYSRESVTYHMNCRGYVPHSCAMVSLILLACCKGPLIYDLISVYQVTDDQLAFVSVIMDVTYMVFWIVLWMCLTIRQHWLFRILDFIPLDGPVFTVSEAVQNAVIRAGSIELIEKKKRPSSIPSVELTPSESGFDDGEALGSSDDGFEATLGTINENPSGNPNVRRQSNGVLIRKTKNRRSGHRSVTFDESVKGASSADDENSSRRSLSPSHRESKVLNVSADVHNQSLATGSETSATRLSSGRTTPVRAVNHSAVKDDRLYVPNRLSRENMNTSSDDAGSSTSDPASNDSMPVFNNNCEPSLELGYFNQRNPGRNVSRSFSETSKSNLKPCNLQQSEQCLGGTARSRHSIGTEEELTNAPQKPYVKSNHFNNNNTKEFLRYSREGFISTRLGHKDSTNKAGSQIYPRPLHIVLRKPEMGRRDSANFSLTSSQETSSNDSDQGTALCSQV